MYAGCLQFYYQPSTKSEFCLLVLTVYKWMAINITFASFCKYQEVENTSNNILLFKFV